MSSSSSPTSDSQSPPWALFAAVAAVLFIVAIVVAVVMTGGSDDTTTATTALEGSTADSAQTGTVSISGDSLPTIDGTLPDPAIGLAAPVVSATDFGGRPHKVGDDGTARLISFFAHWCPHCQAELPIFVEWMAENELPDNVEIVAVSTGVDKGRPNYPPYAWFVREGYEGLVVRDDATNSYAGAYGLSGYPYTVVVGSDGNVVNRVSGRLSLEDISGLIDQAAGGTGTE